MVSGVHPCAYRAKCYPSLDWPRAAIFVNRDLRLMAAPYPDKSGGSGEASRSVTPRSDNDDQHAMPGDATRLLADWASEVHVREEGGLVEEAAVLYANNNAAAAEAALVACLDTQADASQAVWILLLDLYRLSGRRDCFDARGIAYAQRFECSPPPWSDLSGGAHESHEVPSVVNLPVKLDAGVTRALTQLEKIARARGALRVDLGRVRSVDDAGCQALYECLTRLHAERTHLTVVRPEEVVLRLTERVVEAEAPRETWLLLLELLQHKGDEEQFEAFAIDYAVRFEVSPPSWEAAPIPPIAADTAPEDDTLSEELDAFHFEGELTAASDAVLRALADFARDRRALSIECGRLRRVDFVTAGRLFNILAPLRAQGGVIELRRVNTLVAALFKVVGVDQVARITLLR